MSGGYVKYLNGVVPELMRHPAVAAVRVFVAPTLKGPLQDLPLEAISIGDWPRHITRFGADVLFVPTARTVQVPRRPARDDDAQHGTRDRSIHGQHGGRILEKHGESSGRPARLPVGRPGDCGLRFRRAFSPRPLADQRHVDCDCSTRRRASIACRALGAARADSRRCTLRLRRRVDPSRPRIVPVARRLRAHGPPVPRPAAGHRRRSHAIDAVARGAAPRPGACARCRRACRLGRTIASARDGVVLWTDERFRDDQPSRSVSERGAGGYELRLPVRLRKTRPHA